MNPETLAHWDTIFLKALEISVIKVPEARVAYAAEIADLAVARRANRENTKMPTRDEAREFKEVLAKAQWALQPFADCVVYRHDTVEDVHREQATRRNFVDAYLAYRAIRKLMASRSSPQSKGSPP